MAPKIAEIYKCQKKRTFARSNSSTENKNSSKRFEWKLLNSVNYTRPKRIIFFFPSFVILIHLMNENISLYYCSLNFLLYSRMFYLSVSYWTRYWIYAYILDICIYWINAVVIIWLFSWAESVLKSSVR